MRTKRSYFVAVSTLVVMAAASPAADAATPAQDEEAEAPADLPEGMLQALERDLGITEDEVYTRLADEAEATDTAQDLEVDLGEDFGGAWLDEESADLTVAVTDEADAEEVEDAGATPEVVDFSEDELEDAQAGLDRSASTAPDGVTGWYQDVATNRVVVLTEPGADAAGEEFVAAADVDTAAVVVEPSYEQPRPLYDVVGGDAYYIGSGARCSVGFAVEGGFVTAGHCGTTGATTSGSNQVAQGTFGGSVFPGDDYAWVQVNTNWTPTPVVNGSWWSGDVTVAGSDEAPIGAQVCRSGSTTGWRCGTLEARNQTVNYSQGPVSGLTRTSACAEPGDSGGSFVWGDQAQGMTSGGSGSCLFGGWFATTYFQPLNPALEQFGLSLVTG